MDEGMKGINMASIITTYDDNDNNNNNNHIDENPCYDDDDGFNKHNDKDGDDGDSDLKPLTASSTPPQTAGGLQQRRQSQVTTPAEASEELLQDTFSLLMIAKYPKRQLACIWKYLCCGWLWNLLWRGFASCCCCYCSWCWHNNNYDSDDNNLVVTIKKDQPYDDEDDGQDHDEEAQQQQRGVNKNGVEVGILSGETTSSRSESKGSQRRQREREKRKQRKKQRLSSRQQQQKAQHQPPKQQQAGSDITGSTTSGGGFFNREEDYMYLPFWLSWGVLICQMFIYLIVLADLISNKEIPPNVDKWLRLGQIFAVLITVYTQADLIDGIYLLNEGYKKFLDITKPWKFRISVWMRILSGFVGVSATFLLIVYATDAVELLLNFTAMEFVATLDDSTFRIASMGFLGSTLATKTAIVANYRYSPRTSQDGSIKSRYHWYLASVVMVLASFGLVWALQVSRTIFDDNEVYVQFDDTNSPELFGISGVYKGCKFHLSDVNFGPIVYISVSQDCPTLFGYPSNAFYYCKGDVEGWVYTRAVNQERVCWTGSDGQILLRSSKEETTKSDAYDLLAHADANWIFKRPSSIGGEIILNGDGVFIHSVNKYKYTFGYFCSTLDFYYPNSAGDTNHNDNNDATTDQEGGRGIVDQSLNYSSLELDYFPSFNDKDERPYNEIFGLMYRRIFQRPINGQDGKFHVVLYYGLRWLHIDLDPVAYSNFVSNNEFYPEETKTIDPSLFCGGGGGGGGDDIDDDDDPYCWKPFLKHFLSNDSWLFNKTIANVTAISDPMMLLTATDTGDPTSDLQWYEAQKVQREYKYLQPTRPLPIKESSSPPSSQNNLTATGTTADDSYYFQCRLFEQTYCSEDTTVMDIDVMTDQIPSDLNMLAFLGQGVDDFNSNATNNAPILIKSEGHTTLPDLVDDDTVLDVLFADEQARHRFSSCVSSIECVQVAFFNRRGNFREPGRYEIYYNRTLEAIHVANNETVGFWDSRCLLYQLGSNCEDVDRPSPTSCSFTLDDSGNVLSLSLE